MTYPEIPTGASGDTFKGGESVPTGELITDEEPSE
jgi:hypothetical protein